MAEITRRNARMWSRIGIRASYGQALTEIATANPNILALSADLGRSSGLDRFSKDCPDQFINTGISEQTMVGCAAGLARMGFDVFASTFAPFASLRAGEFVRMNMGYMGEPVKLVALGSGFAMGFLGNSHYGLEDLAVMRAIPGLTIISPADCAEVYKTLAACVGFEGPVYIRLTGAVNAPILHEEDYDFRIGRAHWIRPPERLTVIAAGSTVAQAAKAAASLQAEQGLRIGLLNMHTIKPLDTEALAHAAEVSEHIIIAEEHMRTGGLGSAILDHFADKGGQQPRITVHAIPDRYGETGTYEYLLRQHRLDAAGLSQIVREQAQAA